MAAKKSVRLWCACLVLIPCIFVGTWVGLYPDQGDPKNIHYVLWKWGLVPMDAGFALGVMTHDNAQPLVVGKSEEQLKKRFGYLLTLNQTTSYNRLCYFNSDWNGNGKTVKFLRDSNVTVVFKDDKATELVLVKGC
jgi:hypothetical protein